MHNSENTIQLGDRVRLVSDASYWVFEDKEIRIPKDSIGTVVPWNGTPFCAVRFDGIKHPAYHDFPRCGTVPGKSPFDENWQLVHRPEPEPNQRRGRANVA